MRGARLALAFTLAPGCCTMVHGTTQLVRVDSQPPGARVTVEPGGEHGTTPALLELERKHASLVHLAAPGYTPATVPLTPHLTAGWLRNLLWIHPVGWVIGVSIDVGNGSAYALRPETVDVTLAPVPQHPVASQ